MTCPCSARLAVLELRLAALEGRVFAGEGEAWEVDPRRAATLLDVLRKVSVVTGIEIPLILGTARARSISWARCLFALLAHEHGASYPEIARALGRRDHTTALHAHRRGERLLAEDKLFAARVETTRRMLGGEVPRG